jgi:WD40 repeat protein
MGAGVAAAIAVVLVACGPTDKRSEGPAGPAPTGDSCPAELAEVDALVRDGYLHRALDRVESACESVETRRMRAVVLADLGLTERAIAAYREYAAAGGPEASAAAEAAIAELSERPSAARQVSDRDRDRALAAYRLGVNLRLGDEDYDKALDQLRHSYALMPHPLTVVQIGATHAAAGRPAEERRAYARAMAIAEQLTGEPAVPTITEGHAGAVYSVAFSDDGRMLATGAVVGEVRIWDVSSGRVLQSFQMPAKDTIDAIVFSADGAQVTAASDTGTVYRWDVFSGEAEVVSENYAEGPAAIDPSGLFSVHGVHATRSVEFRELIAGTVVHTIPLGDTRAEAFAFSHDGSHLAIGDGDGRVRVLKSDDYSVVREHIAPKPGSILSVELGADPRWTVAATRDAVYIWDGDALLHTLPADNRTLGLQLTDDDVYLLAGREIESAMYDVAAGTVVRTFDASASDIDMNRGRTLIAASHTDARVTLWDPNSGELLRTLEFPIDAILHMTSSPNGTIIGIGSFDSEAKQWNLATGTMLAPRRMPSDAVRVTELTDRGGRMAAWSAGFQGGTFRAWDGSRVLWSFDTNDLDNDEPVAWSDRANRAVYVSKSGEVVVVDTATGNVVHTIGPRVFHSDFWDAEFSPDGDRLAYVDQSVVTIWNEKTGQVDTMVGNGVLAFDPSGSRLAVASEREVIVYDLATRRSLWTAPASGGQGWTSGAAAFSADGSLLATTDGHEAVLWNPDTGAALHRFTSADDSFTGVTFGATNDVVFVSSGTSAIGLWNTTSGERVGTLYSSQGTEWLLVAGHRVDGFGRDAPVPALFHWQVGRFQLPSHVGWHRYHSAGLLATLAGGGQTD